MNNKMLSQSIADTILSMITIEKRFKAGDKLPNKNELSAELNVSRTTFLNQFHIQNNQRFWLYEGVKKGTLLCLKKSSESSQETKNSH